MQLNRVTVQVIVEATVNRDDVFQFYIRFHDNCCKDYKLDSYQFHAYRMTERDLIEYFVQEYYEETLGYVPEIHFIFF